VLVGRGAALCALVAVVGLSSGCATTLQPRTSAELQYKSYKKLGAVIDASRAFPIAFYANAQQQPLTLEVPFGMPSATLAAAQWTTHLAKMMNQALHEVGLYDRRFAAFAHQVFHNNLASGDYVYDFKNADKLMPDIRVSGTRLVKLKLLSAKPVREGADEVVQVTVEATIAGLQRLYQATAQGSNWDRKVFDAIAKKILSDPGFWKVVVTVP